MRVVKADLEKATLECQFQLIEGGNWSTTKRLTASEVETLAAPKSYGPGGEDWVKKFAKKLWTRYESHFADGTNEKEILELLSRKGVHINNMPHRDADMLRDAIALAIKDWADDDQPKSTKAAVIEAVKAKGSFGVYQLSNGNYVVLAQGDAFHYNTQAQLSEYCDKYKKMIPQYKLLKDAEKALDGANKPSPDVESAAAPTPPKDAPEFIEDLKALITKHLPKVWSSVVFSNKLGSTVDIRLSELTEEQIESSNVAWHNSKFGTIVLIYGFGKDGKPEPTKNGRFEFEPTSMRPREPKIIKKTGTQEQILKHFENWLEKLVKAIDLRKALDSNDPSVAASSVTKQSVHNALEARTLLKEWDDSGEFAEQTIKFYTHEGVLIGTATWDGAKHRHNDIHRSVGEK